MNLFFHISAPKTLLALFKKKRMTTNELIESSEAGGSWYSSRIRERLEEMDLITKDEVRQGRKLTIFHELTPKGEEIARKLSYVFDETKEVLAIDKELVENLERIKEAQKLASWQAVIYNEIQELKKKYHLLFDPK